MMNKYVIIKLEEKPYAKSYDEIKEDKYLRNFSLEKSPFPSKNWTSDINNAIQFFDEEDAKAVICLLRVNSPYPMRIEKI